MKTIANWFNNLFNKKEEEPIIEEPKMESIWKDERNWI